jgi:DNA-binding MarR family transcriptional regulator
MYQDREDVLRTVTISVRDARAAARVLAAIVDQPVAIAPAGAELSEKPSEITPRMLLERAKKLFADRRRRARFFDASMFGEPAWDILLALYINEQEGSRQTISRLTEYIGSPSTTILRWLYALEERGLIARESHPNDLRKIFVEITDRGRDALDSYFFETLSARA